MERLKREAEASLQEAQSLAAKLNAAIDMLEDHCRHIISGCLRFKLTQDIDEITNAAIKRVHEEERDLQSYPALFTDKLVMIQATRTRNYVWYDFEFSPVKMQSLNVSKVTQMMEAKFPDVRYASIEEFERRMNSLKSLITNGRIDDLLGMEAKEVLWEAMGRNGRLVPTLDTTGIQKEGNPRAYGHRRVS